MQIIHILLTNGSDDVVNTTQLKLHSSDGKLMFHEVRSGYINFNSHIHLEFNNSNLQTSSSSEESTHTMLPIRAYESRQITQNITVPMNTIKDDNPFDIPVRFVFFN